MRRIAVGEKVAQHIKIDASSKWKIITSSMFFLVTGKTLPRRFAIRCEKIITKNNKVLCEGTKDEIEESVWKCMQIM